MQYRSNVVIMNATRAILFAEFAEDDRMIANENDYAEMFGKIEKEDDRVVAAKCRCVACNSCSCGRCLICIGQCTGCKGKDSQLDLEWGIA